MGNAKAQTKDGIVYFDIEFTTEQIKNQNSNLLDLYHIKVKKQSQMPRLNDTLLNGSVSNILTQNNKNVNRGESIPKPANTPINEQSKSIINILASGDKSTLIHELAHIFLRDIEVIENQGGVQDEQFKKIKSTLDKWLGKKVGQQYTTEQQEKFASGFETYMATGQAPKEELKSVFDYFKKWIGQVYNGIKNMAQITVQYPETTICGH